MHRHWGWVQEEGKAQWRRGSELVGCRTSFGCYSSKIFHKIHIPKDRQTGYRQWCCWYWSGWNDSREHVLELVLELALELLLELALELVLELALELVLELALVLGIWTPGIR